MIPLRTNQIWLGGPTPIQFSAWRADLIAQNPSLEHKLWTEEHLPSLGLTVDRLKDEFGSWASVSNFVRLLVLQKFGGAYLDLDFQPLKPIGKLFDFEGAAAAMQDGGRICNAALFARPNHPWINWQLANIGRYDRRDAAWGVYAATDAPRDGVTIIEQRLVYPFMYDSPAEMRVPDPDSLMIHWWEGSWSK